MRQLFNAFLLAITAFSADNALANGVPDPIGWLEGCWQSEDGRSKEVWAGTGEGELAGFSATAKGDAIRFYEILKLRRDDEAGWVYTAFPSGQQPTLFRADSMSAKGAVFTNPDHDYPQKIVYERDGEQLTATISLIDGDKARTFSMIACEND